MAHGGYELHPPLPLVPYAMSMSTTVIYRAFRDQERDLETTIRDLSLCCDALNGLSKIWTSVKAVSKMAKGLLEYTKSSETGQDTVTAYPFTDVPRTVFKANGTTTVAGYRVTEGSMIGASVPTPPLSVTSGMPLPMQSSNVNVSGQMIGSFPGNSGLGVQLGWDFHDMFDYGMPNVFRDPVSWEDTQMTNGEKEAVGSFPSPDLTYR